MSPPREYKTPQAFKVAIEDRIRRRSAASGLPMNRVRQRFIMERFLARISQQFGTAFVLKGGLALELRLAEARSTKDIDLRAHGDIRVSSDAFAAADISPATRIMERALRRACG